jgi:hypothetical protein
METLKIELQVQNRTLKQIGRQGSVALYELYGPQGLLYGFEVVVIRIRRAEELFGRRYPERGSGAPLPNRPLAALNLEGARSAPSIPITWSCAQGKCVPVSASALALEEGDRPPGFKDPRANRLESLKGELHSPSASRRLQRSSCP